MASVPVEDAGVGSAVNDVSRELGSALGVAAIGSFISSIYRGNVEDRLDGVVDGSVVEAAKEGLGVLGGQAEALPADVALTAIGESSGAFVDAMNSGFWLSAAVLAAGAVLAYTLLPAVSRVEQVERGDEPDPDRTADRNPVGDPRPRAHPRSRPGPHPRTGRPGRGRRLTVADSLGPGLRTGALGARRGRLGSAEHWLASLLRGGAVW